MTCAWIALNSVCGLGPVGFNKLLERYGSPEAVLDESPDRMVRDGLISPEIAAQLHDPKLIDGAKRQLKNAEHLNITILTLDDSRYPPYLREIFAPPPILYARGDFSTFSRNAVAIVGSRSPTVYGKQSTIRITKELVERNVVVVSGLARGIDTKAHEVALDSGGMTIAVLGCGLDLIYPKINTLLAKKIEQNGAIISEFPLGTPPEAFNFPRRNRIISGCSLAVIVVEAGAKSGSLITARYALQQGREVCAVPGPIHSPLSDGTFNLLKEGAMPVRSGHELAECLGGVTGQQLTLPTIPRQELSETLFTEEEKKIYDLLSDSPVTIDAIAEEHQLSVAELFVVLLNLELKGLVQQCSGQQFVRV